MAKSKFFLAVSLILILANFVLLVFVKIEDFDLIISQNIVYILAVLILATFLLLKCRYFLWLIIILLAIIRFYYFIQPEVKTANNFAYGEFYTFEAVIKDTDKKLDGWQLVVQPENLENFNNQIIVYAPLYPTYTHGDLLEISCKVYQPEEIIDDQGNKFAYNKYLAKDRILATCFRPRIKLIENKGQGLFKAKEYFLKNLNNYLVEPASSLSKAIILASRREIPADLREIFAKVGLSHVIAISGLHIAIIVWLLQSVLSALGLSRKIIFYFLIIILLIYLYLLGFPSSAVRASLMVIMVLLGPFLGRQTTSVFSLLLAADIFILLNPYVLIYDIGFQLSFLAVLGLLFYVKFFNQTLKIAPVKWKIREVLAVTLSAQIFTWPLIVFHFNIFSLIAPVANFLILPLLPLILVLSLALAIFGWLPLLANIIAWSLFMLLKIMTEIAQRLSQLPLAYWQINNFSLTYLFLSLFLMIIITMILKPHQYE